MPRKGAGRGGKGVATQAKAKAKPAAAGPPAARGSIALCTPEPGLASPTRGTVEERWALLVLARHVARLGKAGTRLRNAVDAAVTATEDPLPCWGFLRDETGLATFDRERRRFEAIYDRLGRRREGDWEVRKLVSSEGPLPEAWALQLPPPPRTVAQGKSDWSLQAGPPGSDVELPTHEVRFAHDDQSELFSHNHHNHNTAEPGAGSLLQLAVELVCGLTAPEEVPSFTVCRHQGRWYCRSGNRRLAALRLAQRMAPERFARLVVKAVTVDKLFWQGDRERGKRPKLTTMNNGEDCEGRWMYIRETGEVVGHGGADGESEYGADLLALLPVASRPLHELPVPKNGARSAGASTGTGGPSTADGDEDRGLAAGGGA